MGAPESPGPAGSVVGLRQNRSFRALWISQAFSSIGTGAAQIAYPLLILELTHSVAIAGLVGTLTLLVSLAVRLPAGTLSDRLDRRRTMIGCDSVRAGLLLSLGLLILGGWAPWSVVLAIAMAESALAALFLPASMAALPNVIYDSQMEAAWAAFEGRTYVAALVGPPLGGFLFGVASSVPFLADGLGYLTSVVLLRQVRGQFRPAHREATAFSREVMDGISVLIRDPLVRAVVLTAPLLNFGLTGVTFTVIVALRQHGTAAGVIGLVQGALAAGGLCGAFLAPKVNARLRMWQVVLALAGCGALLVALVALLLPSLALVVPLAIVPILGPAANAALFAATMRRVPESMRGRVANSLTMAMSGLSALAPLAAALIADLWSFRAAVLACAAATALAVIPTWLLRRASGTVRLSD